MYKIWRSKQNLGFCGTRVQVGLYSGTAWPDKRCPNCGHRETAAHLLIHPNEDRIQLLIKNTDELGKWLERDDITDSELSYWITKYMLMRGDKPFAEMGVMPPRMPHEGTSSESGCYRLSQFHGRIHIDPLLRDSEFPLGNVQQLSQWIQLDQAIYLQTVAHHTLSIVLLEQIPTQQDQRVSPQQESRRDNDRAGVSGRVASEDVPAESNFLLEINFSNLSKYHIELQKYWILAVNAALSARSYQLALGACARQIKHRVNAKLQT
jgi:hypothetical protein